MNSFGQIFRVEIFGESHGPQVGVLVDGCPAGISLTTDDFMPDLMRRQAGGKGTTSRKEPDVPQLLSGVYQDKTTGAPILISFQNTNTRSDDYKAFANSPRPGHADFTAKAKFKGFNDPRGGGHFSGRLTVALVAAGVIAKKILSGISFSASLIEAGGQSDITAALAEAEQQQDSIGGIVRCSVNGLPIGLGEPFFDSMESMISHIIFAVPAIKGIGFGSGFAAAKMTGSAHNDSILDKTGKTETNFAGGINGGISNGNELVFDIAVKPASSTPKTQTSWHADTDKPEPLTVKGRHDLCIALRVPPVAEAAAAIALADLFLRAKL